MRSFLGRIFARRWVLVALAIAGGLLLVLPLTLFGLAKGYAWVAKPSEAFLASSYEESWQILDRKGNLLREVVNPAGNRARHRVLSEINPFLIQATIAIEDQAFRSHSGVDFAAIFRASGQNLQKGQIVSGASTISMQLARLIFGHGHGVFDKFRQGLDAFRIEAAWTKDRILEEYLNRVSYGNGCMGVEAACQRYFGKPSSHLSISEAAFLAGLPQAPSLYDPLKSPQRAEERRHSVLFQAFTAGILASGDYERALSEVPTIRDEVSPILAGHFTDYVLAQGAPAGIVNTTLDRELNGMVQNVVAEYVDGARNSGLSNAAVVVLDNEKGAILSMVGSRDWSDPDKGSVNGATALRQPGSTLKPIAYAVAFDHGYSQASILPDIETEYYGTDRTLYIPQNYTRTFRGPVLAKEALAYSLNVPAVRLVKLLGVPVFLKSLHDFGFSSLSQNEDYYGLGLVLGNGEVSLLELAGSYASLARGGLYIPPQAIAAEAPSTSQVLKPESAWLITSILSDEHMRVQAFGVANPLMVGYPMAIKTGTSNDWRDNWVIGYTKKFTIAVWTGNFDAAPTNQLSGSSGAGPLFNRIARIVGSLQATMPELPGRPASIRTAQVCTESGNEPGPHCPRTALVDLSGVPALPPCTVHTVIHVDTRNGLQASGKTPRRFVVEQVVTELAPEYDLWLKDSGRKTKPAVVSSLDMNPAGTLLKIVKPRKGDVYIVEPGYPVATQTIELGAESAERFPFVDWYIDGKYLKKSAWPYRSSLDLRRGTHTLTVKAGNLISDPISFEIR